MPKILAARPKAELLLVARSGAGEFGAVAARGLTERVHFAGFCRDIPEILAASGCVRVGVGWEGMPNALLEAMAAGGGKPVVASVGGAWNKPGPGCRRRRPWNRKGLLSSGCDPF